MSLPGKTIFLRLIASALCLLALSVYVQFAPGTALANPATCACGGGLGGQCNGKGQRCVCLLQGTQCVDCVWNDDRTCPCLQTPPET